MTDEGKRREASARAVEAIADERERQITVEGYSVEHDDDRDSGELAGAAGAYAYFASLDQMSRNEVARAMSRPCRGMFSIVRAIWPVIGFTGFKPKGRRRDLVRAGALIVAEIERLDRAGYPP